MKPMILIMAVVLLLVGAVMVFGLGFVPAGGQRAVVSGTVDVDIFGWGKPGLKDVEVRYKPCTFYDQAQGFLGFSVEKGSVVLYVNGVEETSESFSSTLGGDQDFTVKGSCYQSENQCIELMLYDDEGDKITGSNAEYTRGC